MNAVLHWLAKPEWSQVVKVLLHSLWQSAVIAALLAAAMRRVVNPHWRYRLSLLALVTIPVTGIISWAALTTSNRPPPIAAPPIVAEAITPPAVLSENPQTKLILLTNRVPTPTPVRWTAWLALMWILGAVVMLGRASLKLAGAEKLRRSCRPLENAQVAQLLAEARRAVGLTRRIRVALTDQLTSPAVVGVLVPTLILPLSLVSALTPDQIRFILLHELAHIRRGDYFTNLFQLFLEAVLFFNPAVWWISHQVRREREACCDALAIELSGAPADYARTLVHVAEAVLSPTPGAAPAFGNEREPSSLSDRVQRVLVPGYRPALRLTWRTMITAFLLAAVLLVLCAEGARVAVTHAATEAKAETAKPPTDATISPDFFQPTRWPMDHGASVSPGIADHSGNRFPPGLSPLARPRSTAAQNIDHFGDRATLVKTLQTLGVTYEQWRNGHTNGMQSTNGAERQIVPFGTAAIRRAMTHNLTNIILDRVAFEAVPLSNIVRVISDEARQRDPAHRGINIIINPNSITVEGGPGIDVGNCLVTIKPALVNVLLGDALDAIVKSAERPLKLSIEDYAVVISLKGKETPMLFMREFNLDPVVFFQRLTELGFRLEDLGNPTNINSLVSATRSFLAQMGVDLNPTEGKGVYYNDRRGILLVRATMDELDRVEQLLREFKPAPQIKIKVQFVETANLRDLSQFSPGIAGQTNAPAIALSPLQGILTEQQYHTLVAAIDHPNDFNILLESEITTGNGRQARMYTVEEKTIVTDINPKALVPPRITTASKGGNESLFGTSTIAFGPTIDIIPTLTPDGYSVAMTVIPRLTEFLGYEGMTDPTNQVVIYQDGKKGKSFMPRPLLRTQQLTNNAVVRDGMTLVLGALPVEKKIQTKDKVPWLGDIPGVGRLFRRESTQVTTNVLLVFVTPTILDPAGGRPQPSPNASKNGNSESFLTSTNLRPIIDVPIY